jgi:hypothetical protein
MDKPSTFGYHRSRLILPLTSRRKHLMSLHVAADLNVDAHVAADLNVDAACSRRPQRRRRM